MAANENFSGGGFAADKDPEELFCLKWNDFTDNVMATLSDLRHEEDFFDVTLAIDGRQLQAHKLILSACSFFFRKLLRANPAPNPVIVLWDVSYDDMLNILDFMYNGEVRVKQANIQNFLAVAEKFRVRGLCQNESSGQPSRSTTPQPPKSPSNSGNTQSRKRPRRDSGSMKDVSLKNNPDQKEKGSGPVKSEHHENAAVDDDLDDNCYSDSSNPTNDKQAMGGGGGSNSPNLNPGSFLSMAAASLIDPSAAKEFWRHFGINPGLMATPSGSHGNGPGSVNSGSGGGTSSGMAAQPGFSGSSIGSPGGSVTGDGSGLRKPRSVYTSDQIQQLENFFRANEYIDGERKRKLSQLTNIPEHQIKVWFQNRRQKKKREAEAVEQQMYQQNVQQHSLFPPHAPPGNLGSIDPGDLSS